MVPKKQHTDTIRNRCHDASFPRAMIRESTEWNRNVEPRIRTTIASELRLLGKGQVGQRSFDTAPGQGSEMPGQADDPPGQKLLGITRVKEPRLGYEPDQPPFSLPFGKDGMHDADEEQCRSREQKEGIHMVLRLRCTCAAWATSLSGLLTDGGRAARLSAPMAAEHPMLLPSGTTNR